MATGCWHALTKSSGVIICTGGALVVVDVVVFAEKGVSSSVDRSVGMFSLVVDDVVVDVVVVVVVVVRVVVLVRMIPVVVRFTIGVVVLTPCENCSDQAREEHTAYTRGHCVRRRSRGRRCSGAGKPRIPDIENPKSGIGNGSGFSA